MSTERRTGPGRGITLLETLIASAIFVVVLVVVILIHQTGQAAHEKVDVQSAAFRGTATAHEHLKRELRVSRVVDFSGTADRLRFTPPLLKDGEIELSDSGEIQYQPEVGEIYTDAGGDLIRELPGGDRRVLAHLGQEGSVQFVLLQPDLLETTVRAIPDSDEPVSRSELTVRYFLPNQP